MFKLHTESYEWIKNLKVDDEVAVDDSDYWRKNYYRILKVVKIAPTGRIKLSDGSQYQPDGKQIGKTYCYPLRQITPQILEIIERRKLIQRLDFDNFKGKLSIERLETLLEWQAELSGNE